VGEYQPRLQDGTPDGPPIPNYYPPTVTEEEWYAARGGAAQRERRPGRVSEHEVNVCSGLLRDARSGKAYYVALRNHRGGMHRVLFNQSASDGEAHYFSFPADTFEAAVLSLLREVDPREVLPADGGPDDAEVLEGELAGVRAELAEAAAFLDANGFSATIGKRVTDLEGRQAELEAALEAARARAACPAEAAWGELGSLADALESAPDPADARLRLRAVLRRVVKEIWVLVVPRGRDRLCVLQMWFEGGDKSRSYAILHRPPKANAAARTEGGWWARSLADVVRAGDLDLRRREDAQALEEALAAVDPADLAG
jgi:hypothetical protein